MSDEDDIEASFDDLPEWWKRNIEEFDAHALHPYRPPRFSDGEITPEVVLELEEALSVSIRLMAKNPSVGDDWEVVVDGEQIGTVPRQRVEEGYTVFQMKSEEFENLVRDTVEQDST